MSQSSPIERLFELVHRFRIGYWCFSADGATFEWPAGILSPEGSLAYRTDSLTDVLLYLHPVDRPRLVRFLDDVRSQANALGSTFRVIGQDRKWHTIRLVARREPEDKIYGLIRDVSSDEDLSHFLLHKLLSVFDEQSNIAFLLTNMWGTVEYVSKKLNEFAKLTAEDNLVGKDVPELSRVLSAPLRKAIAEALRSRNSASGESAVAATEDGKVYAWTLHIWVHGTSNFPNMLLVVEPKSAEGAIDSGAFSPILHELPTPVLIVSLESGRLLFSNEAAQVKFSIDRQAVYICEGVFSLLKMKPDPDKFFDLPFRAKAKPFTLPTNALLRKIDLAHERCVILNYNV